jgi:hypothetical protein
LLQVGVHKKSEGAKMTECEHMLSELQEKVTKWKSAGEAARKPSASVREKSDFKMIEEEYFALERRVKNCVQETGSDDDRRRFAELGHPRNTDKS